MQLAPRNADAPASSAGASVVSPSLDAGRRPCTRNNRASLDHPLASDNLPQVRLHRGRNQARRNLIRSLLTHADADPAPRSIDDPHPARKLAGQLTACGRFPVLTQAQGTGRICKHLACCRSRICPTCGPRRADQLRGRVERSVQQIDDARLLTLTLRSTDEPLAASLQRLREAWTKLRRRKAWKAHVRGGVSVVEVTYNARTDRWHPHLHVVLDGVYWQQKAIAAAWLDATGDSWIVDIRRVPSRRALVAYVAKYVAKASQLGRCPDRRRAEHALAMRGVRLCQPFGSLHGSMPKDSPPDDEPGHDALIPVEPLVCDAEAGDRRARQLVRALRLLLADRVPDDPGDLRERVLARHRSVARRLRTWWSLRKIGHCHEPPPVDRDTLRLPRHGDRTLWLWQESEHPPSALADGIPR